MPQFLATKHVTKSPDWWIFDSISLEAWRVVILLAAKRVPQSLKILFISLMGYSCPLGIKSWSFKSPFSLVGIKFLGQCKNEELLLHFCLCWEMVWHDMEWIADLWVLISFL
ncbi:hypothetical protein CEXT_345711, partial [Caerostris extrusa]